MGDRILFKRVLDFFIDLPIDEEVYDLIDDCREVRRNSASKNPEMNRFFIGPTGVGKTWAIERYLQRSDCQPYIITENNGTRQDIFPVLSISAPHPFTFGGLNNHLLEAMNTFSVKRATLEEGKSRILKLLKDCKVEAIIIDEIQQLGESKYETPFSAMEYIKTITNNNNAHICLIGFGSEKAEDLVSLDPQFVKRFPITRLLPMEKCDDKFVSFLAEIEKQIDAPFPLGFTNEELKIPELLFKLSKGRIGFLHDLIHYIFKEIGVSESSIQTNNACVNIELIQRAYRRLRGGMEQEKYNKIIG